MSDALSATESRSGTTLHAICAHCGHTVYVKLPASRPREIGLGWTLPLALVIWLAIIWKFGYALSLPKGEVPMSMPVEASFVELPEEATPDRQAQKSEVHPEPRHRPVSKPSLKARQEISSHKDAVARSAPAPVATPTPEQPTDMMAYVNAARARRNATEEGSPAPSADEIRMATIKRNLQQQGANGVFQIVSVGLHRGKFLFRGWVNNASNPRHESIEVEAGPDGDVDRAIVRGMIELIRKYFKGDFNWESQRLDRVVVLSARVADNAGLEDFLMREFFDAKPEFGQGAGRGRR